MTRIRATLWSIANAKNAKKKGNLSCDTRFFFQFICLVAHFCFYLVSLNYEPEICQDFCLTMTGSYQAIDLEAL